MLVPLFSHAGIERPTCPPRDRVEEGDQQPNRDVPDADGLEPRPCIPCLSTMSPESEIVCDSHRGSGAKAKKTTRCGITPDLSPDETVVELEGTGIGKPRVQVASSVQLVEGPEADEIDVDVEPAFSKKNLTTEGPAAKGRSNRRMRKNPQGLVGHDKPWSQSVTKACPPCGARGR